MGGSSSSSENSNTSTTQQYDERVSATDNAVVLRLNEGASINLTDPGAFGVVSDVVNGAFDSWEAMFGQSIGLVKATSEREQQNIEKMMDGLKSEAAQGVDKIIKAGTVIAIGYLAAKHGPQLLKSMRS